VRHQIQPGYGLQKYSGGQKTDEGGARAASEREQAHVPAAALESKPTAAQVQASAAAARHARTSRKPLTEAEKAERRAQMAEDAQQHTAQRKGRFQQEDKERGKAEAEEADEMARQMQRAAKANEDDVRPAFLDAVSRETFAETNINSVAERINQQKYYVQRGTSAAAESFLRND
jgi:hypothetical protein